MKVLLIGALTLASLSAMAATYERCPIMEVVIARTWDLSDGQIKYAVYGDKDTMDNLRAEPISSLFDKRIDAIKEKRKFQEGGICR